MIQNASSVILISMVLLVPSLCTQCCYFHRNQLLLGSMWMTVVSEGNPRSTQDSLWFFSDHSCTFFSLGCSDLQLSLLSPELWPAQVYDWPPVRYNIHTHAFKLAYISALQYQFLSYIFVIANKSHKKAKISPTLVFLLIHLSFPTLSVVLLKHLGPAVFCKHYSNSKLCMC